MSGLWFEEFTPGLVIDHAPRRTVTETDNMWFCNATLNPQPLHIDFHAAAKSEFGKPIVNSVFTLGLMIGMGVERLLWFQTPIERLRSTEEVLKQDLSAIVEGGTTASADGLILRHAELGVLRTAVRRSDAITAQESDAQQRESCLEEALRHAVAMLRLPAGLRPIDAQACRDALRAWPG